MSIFGFRKSKSFIKTGFTIVELLVVIVVIGILVGITIVSYGSITEKAVIESLKADLGGASTQLLRYYSDNGVYPTNQAAIENCPNTDTTMICAKHSDGNTYTYTSTGQTYELCATNTNGKSYCITNVSSTANINPNWLTIGTQTWAKANLNVGTMVTGVTAQTNNSILEKYCYDNLESNCTTYGALYQWDEAMQYVITENAQGICPAGSHIPSDSDWTTLTTYLGEATAGTQLRTGGSSGLNIPIAGDRNTAGSFYYLLSFAWLWSSSESSTSAWYRGLISGPGFETVERYMDAKSFGFSVRCIGN